MNVVSKHWVLLGCVVALAFAGCKSGDDDDDSTTGGGTGGMTAGGTGGTMSMATGGVSGGTGGMPAGTGGMTAATGGTSGGGTGGMAGGGTGGMGGMAGMGGPTGEPKFSAIFEEIIKGTGCNGGTLCHAGTVGKLTMLNAADAYMALVGVDAMGTNIPPGGMDCKDSGLKRVVAGDPDMSLLYLKITGMQMCGNKMPPNGASLDDKQIMQIKTWIMNGAMND